MKIRLLTNLPVESAHGMVAGRVFDVIREPEYEFGEGRGRPAYIVMGDAGREVGVLRREAEIVHSE